MDDNKTNQSLDGMRGGEPNQGTTGAPQNIDGFNAPTEEKFNDSDFAVSNDSQQQNFSQQQPSGAVHSGDGGSGKGLKVLLTLFVILFLAASAAAVYLYTQKEAEPANTATVDVTKLEQQNKALEYDNKTLTLQKTTLTTQVNNLSTTAKQLKTKCGSGCSAIVIPQ